MTPTTHAPATMETARDNASALCNGLYGAQLVAAINEAVEAAALLKIIVMRGKR